jgi:misacylated tRNA(Ala) deacylase
VGNQIHADRSRVDFEPVKLANEDLRDVEAEVNRIVAANVPLRVYEEDRAVLEQRLAADATGDRSLLNLVPQSVRRLRVVEIADPEQALPAYKGTIDFCPCAGTHVARTGELGRMEITGRETKGAQRERVEYALK